MSSELNDDLSCAVCCEIYEEILHEPVLLPQCGHSFCRPCLQQLEVSKTNILCPTCRTEHIGSQISDMPTIYALLSVSRKMLILQKKNEIYEISKKITLQIKEEQESISQRLNTIANELMALYEKSKILKGFINETEEKEIITRKSQEPLKLKITLSEIKSIHSQVCEVTNDWNLSAHYSPSKNSFNIGEANSSCAPCRIVPAYLKPWPKVPWRDFMNHSPMVQLIVPPDNPKVFLDLTVGEISLGRITIELVGHMVRAQHFLALCLGTFGPTYKGSSFDRVELDIDGANRYLIGGYYHTDRGTKSAHGVMEDLEWNGEYRVPSRRGLLAGWSYAKSELEATFGFTCGISFGGSLLCQFGEVLSGMELLDDVS
ncbi:unnamed protein product [Meganyctiphanes norvegica]|uniref:RING-type domain-containing protein n=1 Tax=Meganyctiphanes norvegica TaxID=48144 RepID=A0AAV2Q4G5_MEGNR